MALTGGPAHVPRRRGALRGVRAAGGAAGRTRRRRARPARGRRQLPDADLRLAPLLGAGGGGVLGGVALATLVAIGIGVHNLGEGLAIGTSFAFGELALGTFLIVGFMVHNVTEGLGIAAPRPTRARPGRRPRLAALALIAGAPAILGAWLGGFAANDVLAVLFFAAAAGAAFEVVAEVGRYVARRPGRAPSRLCARRLPRRDRDHVRDWIAGLDPGCAPEASSAAPPLGRQVEAGEREHERRTRRARSRPEADVDPSPRTVRPTAATREVPRPPLVRHRERRCDVPGHPHDIGPYAARVAIAAPIIPYGGIEQRSSVRYLRARRQHR